MINKKLFPFIVCLLLKHHLQAMEPNTVIDTVANPNFAVPEGIAITNDGSKAYVTNNSGSQVSIIDIASNTVTGSVGSPDFASPSAIITIPASTSAYVANPGSNTVSIIDTITDTVTADVVDFGAFINNSFALASNPAGTIVYVINGDGTVAIVASGFTTGQVTGAFNTPKAVIFVSNTKAYVANRGNSTISIIDVIGGTVTGTISLPAGSAPSAFAITPNGAFVYVGNVNNTVSIINTNTDTIVGTVTDLSPATFNFPVAIAITPDGTTGYVVNQNNDTVSIFNVNTNTVTGLVNDPAGTIATPNALAITSDGSTVYVVNKGGESAPASVSIIEFRSPTPTITIPSFNGCKRKNIFLTQTDNYNHLTWTAPVAPTNPIANYKLYRNAALTQLIKTIPATAPLKYNDHDRNPTVPYSYYLVAIDTQGNISTPAVTTVTTNC